ncbi:MAG TPA: hypothetical protein VHD84_01660 [Candidatus Saccharimonadales bacterium]|nr:hypothetical protein [Candidatus Saccharimonadales bacterium]
MYSLDEETNDEENQEKEAQDYSRPFTPPEGTQDTIPEDYPELDTNMDNQEWYDEGRSGAAEVSDPGNQGVLGYTPPPKLDDDTNDKDDENDKKPARP